MAVPRGAGAASAMGNWRRGQAAGWAIAAIAALILSGDIGGPGGVNGRQLWLGTSLAVQSAANQGDGCELGRGR